MPGPAQIQLAPAHRPSGRGSILLRSRGPGAVSSRNGPSPKDRVVIHLHYYEGYTAREIGSQLGISESAVQNRLMRARKRLKSLLKEEEHGQTLSKRL